MEQVSKHEFKTVMHTLKQRRLQVAKIENPTPRVVRITFRAEALSDFTSLSPDDHIKVFFPYPGETDPAIPGGERPALMRDYTPIYNSDKRELQIDFCIHGKGVGSNWAAHAKVGDGLTIGGPKGSKIVPNDFDGYVLIGDETGLPSIRRRLGELPKDVPAVVAVEVESVKERQPLERSMTQIHWVYRQDGAATLLETVQALVFPQGDIFLHRSRVKKSKPLRFVIGSSPRKNSTKNGSKRPVIGRARKNRSSGLRIRSTRAKPVEFSLIPDYK